MKASYQILLWAAITLFGINSAVYAQAQGRKAQFTGTITGIIVDSINKAPIPYSTITILSAKDSSIVGGATSKKEGEFTVDVSNTTGLPATLAKEPATILSNASKLVTSLNPLASSKLVICFGLRKLDTLFIR